MYGTVDSKQHGVMHGLEEKSKGSIGVVGDEDISTRDRAILLVALLIKGGLLGAYVPFFTLWLHVHGYSVLQVGVLSAVDTVFSIILMPILGIMLDKWRCHNRGLVGILVLVAVLKTCYLPVAMYFWLILVLTALTAPLLKAANSVLDAQCLFAFPAKGDFPKIRMWGALGFGLIAYMTGHIVTAHDKPSSSGVATTKNVNAVFYTFVALTLFGALYWEVAHRFVRYIRPDTTAYCWATYCERLRELYILVDFEMALLFVNLFFCGMALGIVGSFEFIMLRQLHMSVHVMGMCRLTGVILEMPFWFFCGTLMDAFGIRTVQTVALLGNSVRLVWYGFMSSPWHALVAEVFHGCTFALPYASISVLAGRVAPESTRGFVQSVVLTIFTGMGAGTGALAGGIVAHSVGIQNMFRISGYFSLAISALLVTRCIWKRSSTDNSILRPPHRSVP